MLTAEEVVSRVNTVFKEATRQECGFLARLDQPLEVEIDGKVVL